QTVDGVRMGQGAPLSRRLFRPSNVPQLDLPGKLGLEHGATRPGQQPAIGGKGDRRDTFLEPGERGYRPPASDIPEADRLIQVAARSQQPAVGRERDTPHPAGGFRERDPLVAPAEAPEIAPLETPQVLVAWLRRPLRVQ